MIIPEFIERDGRLVPNPEYATAKYAILCCDEKGEPIKHGPEIRSNDADYLRALLINRLQVQIP